MKRKSHRGPRKRPQLGDIVEIPLSKGYAYAQYILNHTRPPHWGPLIRVLKGIYDSRPHEFEGVCARPERFLAFYPVTAAARDGFISIVCHADIPERFQRFPLFKAPGWYDPATRKPRDWWLWDGDRAWRVEALDSEQRNLPIREIIDDVILVQRIESGWSPADEVA